MKASLEGSLLWVSFASELEFPKVLVPKLPHNISDTARVNIHQFFDVIFQIKSQFSFKVWITLQCHER